jgi:hypothetical protein
MRSSGRLGMALVVSAAVLIAGGVGGGCKHQTPEQRAQARLAKQQAAEAKAQAKAQQKQAQAQAKAQSDAAKAQANAAKKQADADRKAAAQAQKQADAQAKADAKRAADEKNRQDALAKEQQKQADAQAKADKKAAEVKAAEDKRSAELAAKDQKKQAAMLAKADKKKKPAAAAVAEVPMSADASRVRDIEPVGPVINTAPADAMTLAARQGYDKYADDQKKVIGYPDMKPENRQRIFDQFAQTMAAEGQAADATLSDADFDGAELNATGRSNLALALQAARVNNKLTLYVGTTRGNSETMGDRTAAVERYIKASPWSSVAVTTRQGPNTTNTSSVLTGINALKKLDKESGGSGSGNMSSGDTTGGRCRLGSGSSSSSSGSSSGQ